MSANSSFTSVSYISLLIFFPKINSLFQLTLLIYAEKLEFENSAIVEDVNNVNKLSNSHPWQKESSLDLKFKQRYKVKIDKIQQYDPYQMKKEELSGDISKFLPLQ